MKFSDLNTESYIFDLRTESVIGDPALGSGACEGGDISLPPPPQHLQPTKAENSYLKKKHADVILERSLYQFGSVGGGGKPNPTQSNQTKPNQTKPNQTKQSEATIT